MKTIDTLKHRCKRIYQSYFPARLTEDEHILIKSLNNEKLINLFYDQPLSDQRHSILVYQKSLILFSDRDDSPSDIELLIASCFHDLAKKDSFKSTTLRIVAATITDFAPRSTVSKFEFSRFSFLKRVWIYANHSELSYEIIEPIYQSDFVKYATLFHHHIDDSQKISDTLKENVKIFIQADTL